MGCQSNKLRVNLAEIIIPLFVACPRVTKCNYSVDQGVRADVASFVGPCKGGHHFPLAPGCQSNCVAGSDPVLLLQHAQLSCREFLEATAHNFQAQHAKQQSCAVNCSLMDTSTLFNHMETCTSKAKNVKTWTQLLLPGASHVGNSNAAWQTLLSAVAHYSFKAFDGGVVHVPSTLSAVQTRLLVRLYQGQGYTVKIVLGNGTLRDLTAGEVKTPPRAG